MAIYDLAAVLLPGGHLRLLLELAIERNEEIPALVYEARPVDPRQGRNWRLWREERQPAGNLDASSTVEVIEEVLGRNLDTNAGISSTSKVHEVGTFAGDDNNSRPSAALVPALSSDDSTIEQAGEVLTLREQIPAFTGMMVPLIQPRPERSGEEEEDEDDGIGLSSSGAIKLGLGGLHILQRSGRQGALLEGSFCTSANCE